MNRRGLIGALAAAVLLAVVPRKTRAQSAKKIRPPGALPSGEFEQACIGCIRCAEVCPSKCILFPSVLSLEQALPYLELSERACVVCMKCTQVCPTDALLLIAADPDIIARSVRMGVPVLTRSKCLPWNNTGVCRLCYQVCPYPEQAIVLVGPQKAPLFVPEACIGCGLCEEACPDEASAIVIAPPGTPLPTPTHSKGAVR